MQKSNFHTSHLKPVNWQRWLLILLGVIGIFPLYRFIRKQVEKSKNVEDSIAKDRAFTENQNPIAVQTKADKITSRKDIQADARSLAVNLGTKYSDQNAWWSVFDPRGWTENDTAVADILIRQRLNYKLLERLYFECYTNSRNLSDDVLKLLDADQMKRVQQYLNI